MTDKQMEKQVEALLASSNNGILEIIKAGDPVLRRKSGKAWGALSPELLLNLIEAMRLTMLDAPGVGLAGPQVGLPLSLAVVEDHDRGIEGDERERSEFPFHVIIDPVYHPVEEKGEKPFFEGCLSVPDSKRSGGVGLRSMQLGWTRKVSSMRSVFMVGRHVFSNMRPIICTGKSTSTRLIRVV